MFEVINIDDAVIESAEKVEYKDLTSGMYKCKIMQTRVVTSKKSNAVGLALGLKVMSNEVNEKIDIDKEITIWYIKGDGSKSDYGISMIGALLGVLGLPKTIGGDSFKEAQVIVKEYDQSENKYVDRTENGITMPALNGKNVWCIIALKHDMYNGNAKKQYTINSFYDDRKRSYTEMKENRNPQTWEKRLEYAMKQEAESLQKVSSQGSVGVGYQPYSNTYESNYGYAQSESEVSNEYARMQESHDQPFSKNGNDGVPF